MMMANSMQVGARTGMVAAVLLLTAHASAQSSGRVTVAPAKEVPGRLVHGLSVDTNHGDLPVLIKLEGIEQPVVGAAHLQVPGRAMISVVSYAGVKVSGYAISPKDRKLGLPVRCMRERELPITKECIRAEINPGERVSVVFPEGLDIMTRQ